MCYYHRCRGVSSIRSFSYTFLFCFKVFNTTLIRWYQHVHLSTMNLVVKCFSTCPSYATYSYTCFVDIIVNRSIKLTSRITNVVNGISLFNEKRPVESGHCERSVVISGSSIHYWNCIETTFASILNNFSFKKHWLVDLNYVCCEISIEKLNKL